MYLKVFQALLLLGVLLCSHAPGVDCRERRFTLKRLERILKQQLANRLTPSSPYRINRNCNGKNPFRSINGICNNLRNSLWGAAQTPQPRILNINRFEDGVNTPTATEGFSNTPLPSARAISLSVHLTNSNISHLYSHLLMNWGQFLDHDLIRTPAAEAPFNNGGNGVPETCCAENRTLLTDRVECFPIFTPNDPIFTRTCIPFVRSSSTPGLPGTPVIRYQINDVTSFVDGSQIYGSSKALSRRLRTLRGGLFKTQNRFGGQEGLPPAPTNPANCDTMANRCRFLTGDVRVGEQAGLTSLHTLFVREHNRIAGELEKINPWWSDERLYQTARKIIGAVVQRITYDEFLPVILGPAIMRKYNLNLLRRGRFRGYNENINAGVTNEFGVAAYRFGHSMIRQTFTTSPSRQSDIGVLFDVFTSINRLGSDGLLNGMTVDQTEVLERMITTGVRDALFNEQLDLPALNIQRGRDHGIGFYNDFRRFFGLTAFTNFDDMVGVTHTLATVNALRAVYSTPDGIELFPGGLSEIALGGAIVGETFADILGLQFQRLRVGDRFWHETDDPLVGFTDFQLAEIRKSSATDVFCRNVARFQARRQLFLAVSSTNPAVSCSEIPTINLNAWRSHLREGSPGPGRRAGQGGLRGPRRSSRSFGEITRFARDINVFESRAANAE